MVHLTEGDHPHTPDSLPRLPPELLRIVWPHLRISQHEAQQNSASNKHQHVLRCVSRTARDAVSWLISRTRIYLKHEGGGDWHNLLQSGLEQLTSAFPRLSSLQHLEIFVCDPEASQGLPNMAYLFPNLMLKAERVLAKVQTLHISGPSNFHMVSELDTTRTTGTRLHQGGTGSTGTVSRLRFIIICYNCMPFDQLL